MQMYSNAFVAFSLFTAKPLMAVFEKQKHIKIVTSTLIYLFYQLSQHSIFNIVIYVLFAVVRNITTANLHEQK